MRQLHRARLNCGCTTPDKGREDGVEEGRAAGDKELTFSEISLRQY